jgi:hypothetical protein
MLGSNPAALMYLLQYSRGVMVKFDVRIMQAAESTQLAEARCAISF